MSGGQNEVCICVNPAASKKYDFENFQSVSSFQER
jgi:hypothetical protein